MSKETTKHQKSKTALRKLKRLAAVPLFFMMALLSNAQTRGIRGTVTGNNNEPVIGASVIVKGQSRGTSTDNNGIFNITAPTGHITLVISSVGFKTIERAVSSNDASIEVKLQSTNGELGEVVVTALGISRTKKSLVYAAQTVKATELTEVRDPNNVLNSLSGKVANAVVSQGSGGPGSGARIILRGNRSLQGNNNALIVVDGVPLNNGTNGTAESDFGFVQGSDGASNINPDDIESVTVLRGASAAALYGNQAGNGVIIITTKRGKKEKLTVTLNSGVAVETAVGLPKVQNIYGQGNGGVLNSSSGESWGAKMTGQSFTNYLGNQSSYTAQPNNIKDFFRDGTSFNNSIGISGGGEKAQTYLSYTNNSIQGIVPNNDLTRHTINFRITNQISKNLSTDAKVTYINQNITNRPRSGEENAPVIDIFQIPRNVPLSDAKQYETLDNKGVPTPTPWPSTLNSIYQNPYWVLNRTSINESRDRLLGFLSAKYKITNWLSLSGRANIDRTFEREYNQVSQGTVLWGKTGGDYSEGSLLLEDQWLDAMLEGNNNITKDLKVNYRVGGIFQDNKFTNTVSSANGLNVTNKFSINFATAPSVANTATQVQTQSVFGQVNFSYKDFLYLDASLRNDWDSRLPSPYSFQYPSIGVSAILSDMMKLPKAISFLKTNINYAEVGNGGQFGLLNSVYNYSAGAGSGFLTRSPTLSIPGLKPEIVKNIEIGVEARFIDNRLGFTATYYKSNSFNQLLKIQLPVATGYADQYINAGNIQNSGFEFVLNGTVIKKSKLSWDVALNFATNTNKIIALSDDVKTFTLGGTSRSANAVVTEGGSYGDLVAFQWATDSKGNKVVDDAGKPVLTQTLGNIGNFNPKATLGLTNTIQYGNFFMRLLIDGRVGGTIVSGTEMNLAFSGITEATQEHRDGGWNLGGVNSNGTPVNATISAQDFWQVASGKRYGAGEFFAYDATNFRVREASLGYDIPVKNKNIVQGMRLSLVGRNLFWLYRGSSTLDIPGIPKRKMWFDTDMSLGNGNYQGIEYGTLPSTRSIGVNLQVTF